MTNRRSDDLRTALRTGVRTLSSDCFGPNVHAVRTASQPHSISKDIGAASREVGRASALHDLARRVERLSPSHRDPHRFHEDRSEIVHELRKLASGVGR